MTNETESDSASIEEIVQHVMRAYAAAQGLRAGGYLVSEIAERVYTRLPNVSESSREAFGRMITTHWAAVASIAAMTHDAVKGKTDDEVMDAAMVEMDEFIVREGGSSDAASSRAAIAAILKRTDDAPKSSVETAIDKLFAETESPFPNQSPAAQCVIVLRSGREFQGSLSKHEGGLRMMVPANMAPGKATMLEIYFDYDDVAAVAVQRDIVATAPRIVI